MIVNTQSCPTNVINAVCLVGRVVHPQQRSAEHRADPGSPGCAPRGRAPRRLPLLQVFNAWSLPLVQQMLPLTVNYIV